jgi:hypothetical protein
MWNFYDLASEITLYYLQYYKFIKADTMVHLIKHPEFTVRRLHRMHVIANTLENIICHIISSRLSKVNLQFSFLNRYQGVLNLM